MDPNEVVRQLDALADAIDDPNVTIRSGIEAAEEMATLWLDLRKWVCKGGWTPDGALREPLPGTASERH